MSDEATLTKPSLNAIYDNDIIEENEKEVYKKLESVEPLDDATASGNQKLGLLRILINILVLGISGVALVKVSQNVHDNDVELTSHVVFKPYQIATTLLQKYTKHSDLVTIDTVGFCVGILFGVSQPILDSCLPDWFSCKIYNLVFGTGKKVKSGQISSSRTDFALIVRVSVTLLGISFGLRRIDWENSLQASIAFGLLDPVLWLLFDATISGLLLCILGTFGATSFVFLFDPSKSAFNGLYDMIKVLDKGSVQSQHFALMLYIASFYFCSLIIYGKIGRYLFE